MKAHISVHNKKVLENHIPASEGCNCRPNSDPCPSNGLTKSGVYKATVTINQLDLKEKTYHGMTEGFSGHKHDFEHREKYGTTLSRHI